MIKFCDLTPPAWLRSELDDAYHRVMSSGVYVRGGEVEAFEREWADYNGAKYCVSCGSGLDALQLVLRYYGIKNNRPVEVPIWTATSTWSAVDAAFGFCLVSDYPTRYEAVIKIIVHLYGSISTEKVDTKIKYVVQDCAQAHGLKVTHSLELSSACCWSFYPTKNLGAYGDGGAITTNDDELAEKLKLLRNHGCSGAINSRLDPLQAAFLRVKLPYLDGWNKQRQEFAAYYLEQLKDLPFLTLPQAAPDEAVWHQFVIQSPERDRLKAYLAENGIETMIHYPVPPHRALGYSYDLPEADRLAAQVLSLPIAPHLTMAEIKRVVEIVRRYG